MIAYKQTTLSVDNRWEYQIGVVWSAWIQYFTFALLFSIALICFVFAIILWIKLYRKNGPDLGDESETQSLLE